MKKLLGILSILVLITSTVAIAHTEDEPFSTDLLAGQDTDVGDVLVWNDGDNLYVKYMTEEDWCITETHLHVAESEEDIPQTQARGKGRNNGGNPIPGLFEYSGEHDCETGVSYEIPLEWGCDDNLVIAAHAVVEKIKLEEMEIELYNWGRSSESSDGVLYATALAEAVEEGFDLAIDSEQTVWNNEEYQEKWEPVSGVEYATWDQWHGSCRSTWEVRHFQAYFDLPEDVDPDSVEEVILYSPYHTEYGDIIPINDNIYVRLNGNDIGHGGTSYGALRADDDIYETDKWYMSSSFSTDSEHLQEGENVVDIVTEEFCGWGGMDRLNLKVVWHKKIREETAWGDGDRFVEKGNWATYFTYTVQPVLVDSVEVPADKSTPTESNIDLEQEVEYKIEVVGTYNFRTEGSSSGYLADAEWALRNDAYGDGWTKGDSLPYSFPYNGLDLCFDADENIDWDTDDDVNEDHTYSTTYIGEGSKLSMFIKDSYYGDNSGFLTVNIYQMP